MTPSTSAATSFVPELQIDDPLARHWTRVAMLHLRREMCWRWHLSQRTADTAVSRTLNLARHVEAKADFFHEDTTAAYLTAQLEVSPPVGLDARRGSFAWIARELDLSPAGCFVLGLGLLAALDHGASVVIAECAPKRGMYPTLALAQLLWHRPTDIVAFADPGHVLWRRGLLQLAGTETRGAIDWDCAYSVSPIVARVMASAGTELPSLFEPLDECRDRLIPADAAIAAAARVRSPGAMRSLCVVPLCGAFGADFEATACAIAAATDRRVRRLHVGAVLRTNVSQLRSLLAAAWLSDIMIFLSHDVPRFQPDAVTPYAFLNDFRDVPAALLVPGDESAALAGLAEDLKFPPVDIPTLTYDERVSLWLDQLRGEPQISEAFIAECARRFRLEPLTIRAAAAWVKSSPSRNEQAVVEACRAATPLDAGGLAERVVPRFTSHDLVLAPPLRRQFDEIARAMKTLGDVHYRWGTGRAWNEGGLSILLCGPPGCGKTMFAEALAHSLDLPLYRVDLSQVANKYVGETEKNLKRLFDAADVADSILFFDEADAIFGKRIDVHDAHDRYANLEVSYLLARMERFRGFSILATNRRRDLDDAFLRRLRAVVELPPPESPQRAQIWRAAVPAGVDGSALDFDFLGRQFNLAGGHIRSAMLNACLQSADGQRGVDRPRLTMEPIIAAVKRELDKLKRSSSPSQFGSYAEIARELDRG